MPCKHYGGRKKKNMENTNETRFGEVIAKIVSQLENASDSLPSNPSAASTNALAQIRPAVTSGSSNSSDEGPGLARNVGGALLHAINPIRSNSPASFISNLFLGPVWRGLFGLFGGDDNAQEPVLNRFMRPEDVSTGVSAQADPGGRNAALRGDGLGVTRSAPAPAPQMQVTIQALDARSVLERSDDIASAVRQAMLTNHSINESLTEL
jgi:hypothetical protein